MAKKEQLDYGSIELDNMDLGDWDAGLPPDPTAKKDRGIILNVAGSVAEGLVDTVTNPEEVGRFIKGSLPEGFGNAWDAADNGAASILSIYDNATKELKPGLGQIATKLDRLVPDDSKIAKSITGKLKEWFVSENRNYGANEEARRDEMVGGLVNSVFTAQMTQQAEQHEESKAQEKVDQAIENKRFGYNAKLFGRMDDSLKRMSEYTTSFNMQFQKKSLELQYRTYLTNVDILNEMKRSDEVRRRQLEGVIKNTALPEFLKIKTSERFHQMAKDRLLGGIQTKVQDRFAQGFDNAKEMSLRFVKSFQEGLEAGVSGLEIVETIDDLGKSEAEMEGKEYSRLPMMAKMLGGTVGSGLLKKGSDKLRDLTEKDDGLMKSSQELMRYVANPDKLINEALGSKSMQRRDNDHESVGGFFREIARSFLGGFRTKDQVASGKFETGIESAGMEPVFDDRRMRTTQVEVIPGYLSRILREVTVLNTGNQRTELLTYDPNRGEFRTDKSIIKDMRERLRTKIQSSNFGGARERLAGTIAGYDSSAEERDVAADFLGKAALSSGLRDQSYDEKPEIFKELDEYKSLSEKDKEIIDRLILSKLDHKTRDGQEKLTALTTGIEGLRKRGNDITGELAAYIQGGLGKQLLETGYVEKDGENKWKASQSKYDADLHATPLTSSKSSGTVGSSDINVKENIQTTKKTGIIDKIRNIGIFNWNYKKGEKTSPLLMSDGSTSGPPTSDKEFVGPMAQAVHNQFGDKAAPEGKKIDLLTMNGYNMAAIQELADKFDKLKQWAGFGTKSETAELVEEEPTPESGKRLSRKKGRSISDNTLLKAIALNTGKLVKQNEQALSMATQTGGGGGGYAPNGIFAGAGTGNAMVDSFTQFTQLGIGLLSKTVFGATKTVADGAMTAGGAAKDLVVNNKEEIKKAGSWVLGKAMMVTGKAIEMGGKVAFEMIPGAIKSLKDQGKKMLKFFGSLINRSEDLYVDGRVAIQAMLLEAGHYRDSATGAVLRTMDDIVNAKGDIVDAANRVVVTVEDRARGLFNQAGQRIKSAGQVLGGIAVQAAGYLGKKAIGAVRGLASGLNKFRMNLPSAEWLKEKAGNILGGIGNFSFYDRRSFDVLVQIRDLIAIGKPKKLRDSILNRLPGKIPQSFKSTESKELQRDKASAKHIEKEIDKEETGGDGKSGTFDRLANAGLGFLGDKLGLSAENLPGFVGPTRPGETPAGKGKLGEFFKKLIDKNKGKTVEDHKNNLLTMAEKFLKPSSADDFVGPKLPEMEGPQMPRHKKLLHDLKNKVRESMEEDDKEKAPGLKDRLKGYLGEKTKQAKDKLGLGEIAGPPKPGQESLADKYRKQRDSLKARMDKLLAKKDETEPPEPETPAETSLQPKDAAPQETKEAARSRKRAGRRRGSVKGKQTRRVKELEAPAEVAPAPVPETVPETKPKGKLGKLLAAGKSLGETARGKLGAVGGGLLSGASAMLGAGGKTTEGEQQDPNPQGGIASKTMQAVRRVAGKIGGFNDSDKDGRRDGHFTEQMEKQNAEKQQREKENQDKAAAATAAANTGPRYRSAENVIDTMMNKVGAVFDFIKDGAMSLFSMKGITSVLGKAINFGLFKPLKGIFKAFGFAKGASGAVGGVIKSGLSTVGKLAGLVPGVSKVAAVARGASMALSVAGLGLGGSLGGIAAIASTGLSVLATALASSVVLGAAAIGIGAYGAYRAYKYFTRNNLNDWEKLRTLQYGLDGSDGTKDKNSVLMNLEGYFLDSRIGYRSGQAYILDKKVDHKELLGIVDIDEKDDEQIQRFSTWLERRFKPVFLNWITCLFAINPKTKLSEVDKLTTKEKTDLLTKGSFLSGPYDDPVSPFKDPAQLSTGLDNIKTQVKKMEVDLLEKKDSSGKPPEKSVAVEKMQADKKEKEIFAKRQAEQKSALPPQSAQTPPAPPPQDKTTTGKLSDALASKTDSDDGDKKPEGKSTETKTDPSVGRTLNVATGDLKDGENGMQFIKLKKGARLEGLNPTMLRLFKAMAQEYGEATGKSLTVNDGFRTYAEQEALSRSKPGFAAKPGKSMHEFGLALDIPGEDANALDKLGLMRKYGFTRPIGQEAWHIESAGVQLNIDRAKKDPKYAEMQMTAAVGHGGGGYGTMPNAEKKRRNAQVAMSVFQSSGGKAVDVADSKNKETANEPANTPRTSQAVSGMGNTEPVKAAFQGKGLERSERATDNSIGPDYDPKSTSTETTGAESTSGKPISGDKESVKQKIAEYAKGTKVPADVLQTFAAIESSLNPDAAAKGSNAKGAFGFMPKTWEDQMRRNGAKYNLNGSASPNDLRASTMLAASYIEENSKVLASVKPNPNVADLYAAHFLGPYGANKVIGADPSTPVNKLLSAKAMSGNREMLTKDGAPMTAGEVYAKITAKVKKKASEFGIALKDSLSGAASAVKDTAKKAVEPFTGGDTSPPKPTPSADSKPAKEVIPGLTKPPAPTKEEIAPKKQAPWVLSERPDEMAVGRNSAQPQQSTDLNALSGLGSTLSEQLKVQVETRDVLTGRIAPALEEMVNILRGSVKDKPADSAASPAPSNNRPAPTAPAKSVLDLRRMA